jgi:hypothetical protein
LLGKAYPIVEECNREDFAALTQAERATLARCFGKLLAAQEPR